VTKEHSQGFTLIEMSIVLVIIGLLVGGVLVGQDLIRAAQERAQISQIEKYNTAVNTFRTKYNGTIPGDIDAADAGLFGFAPRGSQPGQGDGNGILEGGISGLYGGTIQTVGETAMFWVDLYKAGFITGGFNTASSTAGTYCNASVTGSAINAFLPQAAIGGAGNYVLVAGGTGGNNGYMSFSAAGPNYFIVEAVSIYGNSFACGVNDPNGSGFPAFTVRQAYDIDRKIDDGLPMSGRVLALFIGSSMDWMDGSPTSAVPLESYYCYNNGAVAGAPMVYNILNYPSNMNCSLAFQFQ
jgi:prepilin-type N-terminal cleavage/methylation domain-containing protein